MEKHFIGYYSLQRLRLTTFTTIQKCRKEIVFLRKFRVSLFLMTVFFFSLSVSFFLVAFFFFHIRGCNITGFGLTIKIAMLASKLLIVASPLFDHYYEHQKMSQITFVHFFPFQVPSSSCSFFLNFFFVKKGLRYYRFSFNDKKRAKLANQPLLIAAPLFGHFYDHQKIKSWITMPNLGVALLLVWFNVKKVLR